MKACRDRPMFELICLINVFAESALSNLLCICSSARSTGPAIHVAVASPSSFDATKRVLRRHTSLATQTHVTHVTHVSHVSQLCVYQHELVQTPIFHRHQPRQTT